MTKQKAKSRPRLGSAEYWETHPLIKRYTMTEEYLRARGYTEEELCSLIAAATKVRNELIAKREVRITLADGERLYDWGGRAYVMKKCEATGGLSGRLVAERVADVVLRRKDGDIEWETYPFRSFELKRL